MNLDYLKPKGKRFWTNVDKRKFCHEGTGLFGVAWIKPSGGATVMWHETEKEQRKHKYHLRKWYKEKLGINLFCKLISKRCT
ncbi:MAG TPA: hypothetical protein ENH82_09930 [bacterium]|nr:hypothetical protein [bacterium]